MRPASVSCLAALLLLAGCAGGPAAEEAAEGDGAAASPSPSGSWPPVADASASPPMPRPPSPAQADPLEFTLAGCTNFGGVFPVPMDAAAAALPAGFEPVPSAGDPAGGATLYVLGLRCEASAVGGRAAGPADLAYAELAVVPPADRSVDGIADCTVPLAFASSNPAVGAVLAAAGLGAAGAGEVAWTAGAAGDVTVTAAVGSAVLTLRGAALPTPPEGLGSAAFVLYGVQEGQLRSTLRAAADGGEAVQAAVTLQASGSDVLEQARPAARGFSVSGFGLSFASAGGASQTP